MERIYRTKRSSLYIGLMVMAMSVFFLCAGVCMIFLDESGPPGRGFFVSAGGLFFLTISAFLIATVKERLIVSEQGVEQIGAFTKRSIEFKNLTETHWGLSSELGKLILHSDDKKLVVEFGGYNREQGRELVRFFRHRLPQSIQQGWERYWNHFWPRFDEPDTSDPEAIREATRKLRLRMFYIFLGGYFSIALCLFFVWRYLNQNTEFSEMRKGIGQPLGSALFLLIIGVWMIFYLSAEKGKVRQRLPQPRTGEGLIKIGLVGALMAMPVCLGFYLWLGIFNIHQPAGFIVCISTMLFFSGLMFLGMHQSEKSRKNWRSEGAKMAEELYMKLPEGSEKERG